MYYKWYRDTATVTNRFQQTLSIKQSSPILIELSQRIFPSSHQQRWSNRGREVRKTEYKSRACYAQNRYPNFPDWFTEIMSGGVAHSCAFSESTGTYATYFLNCAILFALSFTAPAWKVQIPIYFLRSRTDTQYPYLSWNVPLSNQSNSRPATSMDTAEANDSLGTDQIGKVNPSIVYESWLLEQKAIQTSWKDSRIKQVG